MHYIEIKKSSLKGDNARELKFIPAEESNPYKIGEIVRVNIITDRGTLISTKEKRVVSVLGSNPFIKSGKVLLGLSDD